MKMNAVQDDLIYETISLGLRDAAKYLPEPQQSIMMLALDKFNSKELTIEQLAQALPNDPAIRREVEAHLKYASFIRHVRLALGAESLEYFAFRQGLLLHNPAMIKQGLSKLLPQSALRLVDELFKKRADSDNAAPPAPPSATYTAIVAMKLDSMKAEEIDSILMTLIDIKRQRKTQPKS